MRQTFGIRLWRPVAEKERGWDFDYEGVWQFGTFGSANIRAWTLASDTGYTIPTWRLKPRFSLKADVSSGDNPVQTLWEPLIQYFLLGTTLALLPILALAR